MYIKAVAVTIHSGARRMYREGAVIGSGILAGALLIQWPAIWYSAAVCMLVLACAAYSLHLAFVGTLVYLPFQTAWTFTPVLDVSSGRFLLSVLLAYWVIRFARRAVTTLESSILFFSLVFLFAAAGSLLFTPFSSRPVWVLAYLGSIFGLLYVAEAYAKYFAARLPYLLTMSAAALSAVAIAQFILQFIWPREQVLYLLQFVIHPFFAGEATARLARMYSSLTVDIGGVPLLRAAGFVINPHTLVFFLGVGFVCAVAWLSSLHRAPGGVRTGGRSHGIQKTLVMSMTGIIVLAILLTFSRGAYVALAVTVLAAYLEHVRKPHSGSANSDFGLRRFTSASPPARCTRAGSLRLGTKSEFSARPAFAAEAASAEQAKRVSEHTLRSHTLHSSFFWVGAIVCVVALALVLGKPLTQRILTTTAPYEFSRNERIRLWRESGKVIAAYPLTGVGLGGLGYALERNDEGGKIANAHNVYLEMGAETGVVGLTAFVLFFTKLFQLLRRPFRLHNVWSESARFSEAWRHTRAHSHLLTMRAAYLALIWFFVQGVFETHLYAAPALAASFALWGAAIGISRMSGARNAIAAHA